MQEIIRAAKILVVVVLSLLEMLTFLIGSQENFAYILPRCIQHNCFFIILYQFYC